LDKLGFPSAQKHTSFVPETASSSKAFRGGFVAGGFKTASVARWGLQSTLMASFLSKKTVCSRRGNQIHDETVNGAMSRIFPIAYVFEIIVYTLKDSAFTKHDTFRLEC
jgi:hypothetical protein